MVSTTKMISEKLQLKKNVTETVIKNSNLSLDEQTDLIDLLNDTLEGTNGLTEKEKLQNVSVSIFNLTRIFCNSIIQNHKKTTTWKDVIVLCKNQIMWLGFGLVVLLALRPEISAVIEHMCKGN